MVQSNCSLALADFDLKKYECVPRDNVIYNADKSPDYFDYINTVCANSLLIFEIELVDEPYDFKMRFLNEFDDVYEFE
eukprot:CAMPEP_0116938870 /NCGR_PEP_ID=MMETSP0467-20121206/32394_1 /TAXON_ID=283647 /ORGANISM="Mesodinium pulex, Strain SPMC105" /LENGTH=77 /DNA_ID=CAMNT_0004621033 /DNA_START=156 /DNA_END=389 /DNA_ORIENTATION=+